MKKILMIALCLILALGLFGCKDNSTPDPDPNPGTENPGTPNDPDPVDTGLTYENIKIGLIYIGDASDNGYNYAHDKGRAYMQEELGLSDSQIIIKQNVPEDSACADAISELLEAGCNVIFGNSFGFQNYMAEAAEEHPDVFFCHATGVLNNDTNFANYFGRVYQPRYLAGIAAGMKTESGKIGYVGAFKNAEVNCGLNAFALGVQSVNPDAVITVKYTNSWYSPEEEKAAAEALLDLGCDVIAQHVDTTGPQVAAQERGKWGCGYNNDMTEFAPDAHLCAPVWNWGAIMKQLVEDAVNGTFTGGLHLGSMEIGTCILSPLTKNVAEGTQEKVDEMYAKIVSGEFDVFEGPLFDNQGNQVLEEGQRFSDEVIYSGMADMLLQGIVEG